MVSLERLVWSLDGQVSKFLKFSRFLEHGGIKIIIKNEILIKSQEDVQKCWNMKSGKARWEVKKASKSQPPWK